MLDLKRFLTKQIKVLKYMTEFESHVFTHRGKNYVFWRIGPIVYLDAPGDASSAAAGFEVIGTLPESFWPRNQIYLGITNAGTVDIRVSINKTGVVSTYNPTASSSAHNHAFCGYSYLTQDGYDYFNGGGSQIHRVLSRLARARYKFKEGTTYINLSKGGGLCLS